MQSKFLKVYFDLIYNPVYDSTTAQLPFYQRFQKTCIDKLQFEDNDHVLCVGAGTGNEILRIAEKNSNVSIWSIDYSERALNKACRKAAGRCREMKVSKMDAHQLGFEDETFQKVICIHVMGFLANDRKATEEILRVLKKGGQFVITYPSGSGSFGLAAETMKSIGDSFSSGKFGKALRESLALLIGGVVYIPGYFRVKPRQGFYSYQTLKTTLDSLHVGSYLIEEDHAYQDFIVFGKK